MDLVSIPYITTNYTSEYHYCTRESPVMIYFSEFQNSKILLPCKWFIYKSEDRHIHVDAVLVFWSAGTVNNTDSQEVARGCCIATVVCHISAMLSRKRC